MNNIFKRLGLGLFVAILFVVFGGLLVEGIRRHEIMECKNWQDYPDFADWQIKQCGHHGIILK